MLNNTRNLNVETVFLQGRTILRPRLRSDARARPIVDSSFFLCYGAFRRQVGLQLLGTSKNFNF